MKKIEIIKRKLDRELRSYGETDDKKRQSE